MIKLIIFDAGNILYKFSRKEFDKVSKFFLKKHNMNDLKKADKAWSKIQPLLATGKINLKEAHRKWVKTLGIDEESIDEWKKLDKEFIKKYYKRIKGVRRTLKKLKGKYKLAVLSNSVHKKEVKEEIFKNIKINNFFDYVFTSHDIGFMKPHKKAFLTVLKYFNVKPSEVVFVGHSEDEIEGARKLEIKTIAIDWDEGTESDFYIKDFSKIPRTLEKIVMKE